MPASCASTKRALSHYPGFKIKQSACFYVCSQQTGEYELHYMLITTPFGEGIQDREMFNQQKIVPTMEDNIGEGRGLGPH